MSDNFIPLLPKSSTTQFYPLIIVKENGSGLKSSMQDDVFSDKENYNDLAYQNGYLAAQDEMQKKYEFVLDKLDHFFKRAEKQLAFDSHYLTQHIFDIMRNIADDLALKIDDEEGILLTRIHKLLEKISVNRIVSIQMHKITEPLWENITIKTGIEVKPSNELDIDDICIFYETGFLVDKKSDRIDVFRAYFHEIGE